MLRYRTPCFKYVRQLDSSLIRCRLKRQVSSPTRAIASPLLPMTLIDLVAVCAPTLVFALNLCVELQFFSSRDRFYGWASAL